MYSLDIILKVSDFIRVSAALVWQASFDLTCFRNDTEACATFVIFLQSFTIFLFLFFFIFGL